MVIEQHSTAMTTTSTMDALVKQVVLPLVFTIGLAGMLHYVSTGNGDRYWLRDAMQEVTVGGVVE